MGNLRAICFSSLIVIFVWEVLDVKTTTNESPGSGVMRESGRLHDKPAEEREENEILLNYLEDIQLL